jgi:hypothetical protein
MTKGRYEECVGIIESRAQKLREKLKYVAGVDVAEGKSFTSVSITGASNQGISTNILQDTWLDVNRFIPVCGTQTPAPESNVKQKKKPDLDSLITDYYIRK